MTDEPRPPSVGMVLRQQAVEQWRQAIHAARSFPWRRPIDENDPWRFIRRERRHFLILLPWVYALGLSVWAVTLLLAPRPYVLVAMVAWLATAQILLGRPKAPCPNCQQRYGVRSWARNGYGVWERRCVHCRIAFGAPLPPEGSPYRTGAGGRVEPPKLPE